MAHLTPNEISEIIEGKPIEDSHFRHLRTGCSPCHEGLWIELDIKLVSLEKTGTSRDKIRSYLEGFGAVFDERHLCHLDQVEGLVDESERPMRHIRYCRHCEEEIEDLDQMFGPPSSFDEL